MDISFFTTLQADWLNAWIPAWGMVLIQFVLMAIFKEGGKRATDTSWYNTKDTIYAVIGTILQVSLLVLCIFLPFKFGTVWFIVGAVIFMLSFIGFILALHHYNIAPAGKTIKNGIYRYSRNPMYFFFLTSMYGVCIATASLWMFIILIPFTVAMHLSVLSEERYCKETYGKEYETYKANTPRYFLFF